MPFLRTMLIITALVAGWIAMRTESLAHNAPHPPSAASVKPPA